MYCQRGGEGGRHGEVSIFGNNNFCKLRQNETPAVSVPCRERVGDIGSRRQLALSYPFLLESVFLHRYSNRPALILQKKQWRYECNHHNPFIIATASLAALCNSQTSSMLPPFSSLIALTALSVFIGDTNLNVSSPQNIASPAQGQTPKTTSPCGASSRIHELEKQVERYERDISQQQSSLHNATNGPFNLDLSVNSIAGLGPSGVYARIANAESVSKISAKLQANQPTATNQAAVAVQSQIKRNLPRNLQHSS